MIFLKKFYTQQFKNNLVVSFAHSNKIFSSTKIFFFKNYLNRDFFLKTEIFTV